jgi:hypothetical protein
MLEKEAGICELTFGECFAEFFDMVRDDFWFQPVSIFIVR